MGLRVWSKPRAPRRKNMVFGRSSDECRVDVQPRALTQPLASYLGGNNIHDRTPCACVLLRDRLHGFCFCSFPAFPMKSRRSIHGEGRSTARSPPTQEAEALETTLPKNTAETAAAEGCQWPAGR